MEIKFSYRKRKDYQSDKKEGDIPIEEKEMDKKGISWMQVIQFRV